MSNELYRIRYRTRRGAGVIAGNLTGPKVIEKLQSLFKARIEAEAERQSDGAFAGSVWRNGGRLTWTYDRDLEI